MSASSAADSHDVVDAHARDDDGGGGRHHDANALLLRHAHGRGDDHACVRQLYHDLYLQRGRRTHVS